MRICPAGSVQAITLATAGRESSQANATCAIGLPISLQVDRMAWKRCGFHSPSDALVLDREAYRRRSIIECYIGWLKECRRLATRFEKLAVNFLAMAKVPTIQRILRILSSDRA